MTETEKAIRDFCGHHADWWPSTTQVQEMLALAQPEQEPAIGDVRALKHRIHALEGEVIGYKRILDAQLEQEPVAWMTINEYGEEDDIHYENPEGHLLEGWTYKPLYTHPPSVQPVKLRRGDILRCIETDELCTVWSTSTTGKALVKWSANDFGEYTAEQIGELFWLEPKPEQEPVVWMMPDGQIVNKWALQFYGGQVGKPLYTTPPQRKPLKDEEIEAIWRQAITQDNGRNAHLSNQPFVHIARAIEAAHGIKETEK